MNNRILNIAGIITESEISFHMDLPEEIATIHNAFKENGKKLYIVGGSVRDALLGQKPKDFDLVTDAIPSEVQNILDRSNIKNIPKGQQFGVISAIINGQEFEIATMREESYEGGDGRRPSSVSFSDMSGDVRRRDLTVNSLYYDIDQEKIIDLVGGVNDLKNGIIKAVGNVMDRFNEDRLRSLRFLRFSHRFGSKLDDETIKAIKHFKTLPGVSNERIRDEFLKGLKSAIHPEKYLQDYLSFGLLPRVFEGVDFDTKFVTGLKDPLLVMAKLLLPNRIETALKSLQKFTASNEEKENIKFLFSLYYFLKDFDKLVFVPEIDGKKLMGLYKSRTIQNKDISDEQIIEWATLEGLDKNLVKSFLKFKPQFSASDFPDLPQGAELGNAISKANAEQFIKSV